MKKRCKRKVYQLLNPISMAIMGAAVSGKKPLDQLRLAELSAFDAVVSGKGCPEDMRWLIDVLNISECMAKDGIGPELLPICKQAQESMLEAVERYNNTGKLGLSGVGIKAVKEMMEMHDLQRTSVARSVYENAIRKTANRIRSKAHEVVEIK